MKRAFDQLTSKDETLKAVADQYGLPDIQFREQGFAAMCHIILEQQVSISSARATYRKLSEHIGEITPKTILNTSDEAMRGCGISRQKTLYLKDMAAKIESGTLNFSSFPNLPEAEIREKLLAIKGVGNWSAEVYLMFCLQSPDIIPLGDIAIRHAMKELYDCATLEEMEALSEGWKPFRTYASYLLWYHYLRKRNRTV